MHSPLTLFRSLAFLSIIAGLTLSRATAQDYVILGKRQLFIQKSSGSVQLASDTPYVFNVSSSKSGLVLTIPGGASYALTADPHDGGYQVQRSFATKAALDVAFPTGLYTITGGGISPITINLAGDQYPVVPQVIGATWNAGGAIVLPAGAATAINYTTFTGFGSLGFANEIASEFESTSDVEVWSRALPFFNFNVGAQPTTSQVVPAGTTRSNALYTGGLTFTTYPAIDSVALSNGLVGTFYEHIVDYTAVAVSSGTGGNPAVITRQPVSQSAPLGGNVTFSIATTSGSAAGESPVFGWRHDNEYIGEDSRFTFAANGSLTIHGVVAGDLGNYAVRVRNSGGIVVSSSAALTLTGLASPSMTAPPASRTVGVGQAVTLSATAAGGGTLLYQWSKDGALIVGAKNASLALSNIQPSAAGNYTVTVSNESGFITSDAAIVAVSTGPGISSQPLSQNVASSAAVSFTVTGTGTGLTYQWKKNGVAIAGATAATYTIASAQTSDMGFYLCVVSAGSSSTDSSAAILTVVAGAPARPVNISTRAPVTSSEPLTAGFVLSAPKTLLIRASGPGLAQFGVPGTLADPKLEIIPLGGSTASASNNDWGAAPNLAALNSATTATGAFAFPAGSKDAAVLVTLPAGGYTATVTGADGGSGVALIEVYDADPLSSSGQLINISARASVGTGANNLATGFVVAGVAPRQVLIRATGPTLAAFGVTTALNDPQVTVTPTGASYSIASNDNWGGSAALKAASLAAGAFPLDDASRDAVVLLRLPPGGYTAVVSGVGGTTGTALVEVYDLGP